MAGFLQVFCWAILMDTVAFTSGTPFGEISLKKEFGFEFKPLPFRPIHFIKEKWTPWGIFGMKHGIEKRDLDKVAPLQKKEEKEVIENRLPAEVEQRMGIFPQGIGRIPLLPSSVGPFITPQIGPVHAPPPPEVIISPSPPKMRPAPGLNTNIARDHIINGYLKEVEHEEPEMEGPDEKVFPPEFNSIEKLPPKLEKPIPIEKEEDNPFIRGSKLAYYFGNLLLDMMARFLGRPIGPVKE